jgi:hypothetical protein
VAKTGRIGIVKAADASMGTRQSGSAAVSDAHVECSNRLLAQIEVQKIAAADDIAIQSVERGCDAYVSEAD